MASHILKNIIKTYFEKYLQKFYDGKAVNEVIFMDKKIFLKVSGQWLRLEDEKINNKIIVDFAKELSNLRGERFNGNYPFLSTELPEPYSRYRVQCFGEEILYERKNQIIIRIPSDEKFELEDFFLEVKNDYQSIRNLVKNKSNILISGGTGTGKTSLLNALLKEIDESERIVTIEDVKELHIKNENKAQIAISKQGRGLSYEEVLNLVMRSAPDRIFLGEIDTRNTLAFLRLANTGHSGMISTIHANSARDAIEALKSNALFGSTNISGQIDGFIRSAIDYIIQIQSKRIVINGETKTQRIISEIRNLKNEDF